MDSVQTVIIMIVRDDNPESFLPSLLENGRVMAEIGCGGGRYCKVLANYSSVLYCIDIYAEALKKTEKLLTDSGKTNFKVLTSTSAIKSHTVDLVLFANSFHDVSEKTQMEVEASRILKKLGKIIIVDWRKDSKTLFGPPRAIRLSQEDYMDYFGDFKVSRTFDSGANHFGLVLERKE